MFKELNQFLRFMRNAFLKQKTHHWFVVVFIGFILRTDTLGVTSIIRALTLLPGNYELILNFFHSGAWSVTSLTTIWWQWLMTKQLAYTINDRLVLLADHTKMPKDGRKIPAVSTLHQDSETASKPSFFRGHHWGCITMLMQGQNKFFATGLLAQIHDGLSLFETSDKAVPKTVKTVNMAETVINGMGIPCYLRFILIENSRGRIILITSDLTLDPMKAMQLYCLRTKIETLFDTLKNTFGAMGYHFWSQYLSPASRKPKKNTTQDQVTVNLKQTRKTLDAIEKFVNIHLLVLGFLQYVSVRLPEEVKQKSICWLRTESSKTPSEFVAKLSVTNLIKDHLRGLRGNWIIDLIRSRQDLLIKEQRRKMIG